MWALPLAGERKPTLYLKTGFNQHQGRFSPDARWVAYTSDESGTNEVYVRPFPNTGGGRWQVSNGGGAEPRWSGDGRAVYFVSTAQYLVEARVQTSPTFRVSGLTPLFATAGFLVDAFQTSYDVSRDGRAFVFVSPRPSAAHARAPQLVRVDNWFSDLRNKLTQ